MLQAKLKIGEPNDKYEQKVDSGIGQRIQRLCPECEEELHQQQIDEEGEETLWAKENSGHISPGVTLDLEFPFNH